MLSDCSASSPSEPVAASSHHFEAATTSTEQATQQTKPAAWRLLLVDSDCQAHATLHLALQALEFDGRPVELLHAFSCPQAQQLLQHGLPLDLLLIDQHCGRRDSAIDLLKRLRGPLGQRDCRVLVHSDDAQPSPAPFAALDIEALRSREAAQASRWLDGIGSALHAHRQRRELQDQHTQRNPMTNAAAELFSHRDARSFARAALRRLVALLGLPAAALLCVHRQACADENWPISETQLLAALGPLNVAEGLTLDWLPEHALCLAVEGALRQKSSGACELGRLIYLETAPWQIIIMLPSLADVRPLQELEQQPAVSALYSLVAAGLHERL